MSDQVPEPVVVDQDGRHGHSRVAPLVLLGTAGGVLVATVLVVVFRAPFHAQLLLPVYRGIQYAILYISILPEHAVWLFLVAVLALLLARSFASRHPQPGERPPVRYESADSRRTEIQRWVARAPHESYYQAMVVDLLITLYLRSAGELGPSDSVSARSMKPSELERLADRLPDEVARLLQSTIHSHPGSVFAQVRASVERRIRMKRNWFVEAVAYALARLEGEI